MRWFPRKKEVTETVPEGAVTLRVNQIGDEIAFSLHACRVDGSIFWARGGTPAWHIHRTLPFGLFGSPVKMKIFLIGSLFQRCAQPMARLTCPECAFHIEIQEDGLSEEELLELFREYNHIPSHT